MQNLLQAIQGGISTFREHLVDLLPTHFACSSGVHQTDGHLLMEARARVTFSRMSEAFAVQMKGLGF